MKDLVTGKSFWERKEGTTGMIFITALLLGGGFATWTYLLPRLIYLAQNTLYLGGLVAAIVGLGCMVASSRCRTLIGYGFKSLMRAVTGLFVDVDPIGILKSYVEDIKAGLERFAEEVASLTGQCQRLRRKIDENQQQHDELMSKASAARRKNREHEALSFSRNAETLSQSNQKLQAMLDRIEQLRQVMQRVFNASQLKVQDIEFQVGVATEERKAMQAASSALKRAKSILKGDGAAHELYDLAMESVTDKYYGQLGEIELFLSDSASMLNEMDFEREMLDDKAMERLDQWEKSVTARETKLLTADPVPMKLPTGQRQPVMVRSTE